MLQELEKFAYNVAEEVVTSMEQQERKVAPWWSWSRSSGSSFKMLRRLCCILLLLMLLRWEEVAQIFLQIRETQSHGVARKGKGERERQGRRTERWKDRCDLDSSGKIFALMWSLPVSSHSPEAHPPLPLNHPPHHCNSTNKLRKRAPVIISEDNAASYTAHMQQRVNSANFICPFFWAIATPRRFTLIVGVLCKF